VVGPSLFTAIAAGAGVLGFWGWLLYDRSSSLVPAAYAREIDFSVRMALETLLTARAIGAVTIALALFGCAKLLRERTAWLLPAIIFAVSHIALHMWWGVPYARFYIPVLPLVSIAAAAGAVEGAKRWTGGGRMAAVAVIVS